MIVDSKLKFGFSRIANCSKIRRVSVPYPRLTCQNLANLADPLTEGFFNFILILNKYTGDIVRKRITNITHKQHTNT